VSPIRPVKSPLTTRKQVSHSPDVPPPWKQGEGFVAESSYSMTTASSASHVQSSATHAHMEQHWEGSYGLKTTGAAVSGVAVREVRRSPSGPLTLWEWIHLVVYCRVSKLPPAPPAWWLVDYLNQMICVVLGLGQETKCARGEKRASIDVNMASWMVTHNRMFQWANNYTDMLTFCHQCDVFLVQSYYRDPQQEVSIGANYYTDITDSHTCDTVSFFNFLIWCSCIWLLPNHTNKWKHQHHETDDKVIAVVAVVAAVDQARSCNSQSVDGSCTQTRSAAVFIAPIQEQVV
jgi:hypothetical protein